MGERSMAMIARPKMTMRRRSCPTTTTAASRRTAGTSTRSRGRTAVVPRAGFIGSETNLIMIASTGLCLAAGRFGLAPSTRNQVLEPGLKLEEVTNDMKTGDPAGFTAVDVLALGSFGHAVGIGIVLGLKGIWKI